MCREKRGNKMDLRTLRYFTVVAEELNITHAAEAPVHEPAAAEQPDESS